VVKAFVLLFCFIVWSFVLRDQRVETGELTYAWRHQPEWSLKTGVARGGYMNQTMSSETSAAGSKTNEGQSIVLGLWGVRYQVKDVSRSVDFYTKHLGLKLDMQNLPALGQVSIGNLKLILSGPWRFGFSSDA